MREELRRQRQTTPVLEADERRETYGVYSAVLAALASRQVSLPSPIQSPIAVAGITTMPQDRSRQLDSLTTRLPDVPAAVVADFRRAIQIAQPVVTDGWANPAGVSVKALSAIDQVSTNGLVAFSPVGFDTLRAQAVVYVHVSCSYSSGTGFYAVLVKENRAWHVRHVDTIWSY